MQFKSWGLVVIAVLLIGACFWIAFEIKEQQDPLQQSEDIDQTEQLEKERIAEFFADLRQVYGYLYTDEENAYQLFITIDEALLEGELSGSLLMVTDTGDSITYDLSGITDGRMIELFTTVDGESVKLEGDFLGDASSFELSFWLADESVLFEAVTEEEYGERYEEFLNRGE